MRCTVLQGGYTCGEEPNVLTIEGDTCVIGNLHGQFFDLFELLEAFKKVCMHSTVARNEMWARQALSGVPHSLRVLSLAFAIVPLVKVVETRDFALRKENTSTIFSIFTSIGTMLLPAY